MKIRIFLLLIVLTICSSCSLESSKKNDNQSFQIDKKYKIEEAYPKIDRDLDDILKDGKIRVSTTYSGTSYFLYKGKPMGFEYELLERFADHIGLNIEIIVANDIDSLIRNVNNGKVDLIAHGLTITEDRKQDVLFSDYIYLAHQVLVQKKPDNWRTMKKHEIARDLIQDAIELDGQTVSVRGETAYSARLKNLSQEMGGTIFIDTLNGTFTTDEIIKMVANGQVEYTISDNNIANILASYYPILNVDVPISFSQRNAWATRKSSPKLNQAVNEWLSEFKKQVDYYVIYNKYFKNERDFRRRVKSDFYSLSSNSISKYDDVVKLYANNIDWDWRMLSSLIYQESRFDPYAGSWVGAVGLMQMMPATAKEMGVKNRKDPHDNLNGGTKYLQHLWERFGNIPDEEQRLKFTMASYNCGYGHVLDAQRLAAEKDLDTLTWDDNVDLMILALSSPKNYNKPGIRYGYVRGIEPYTYVQQIFERYNHYEQFITE
ncbi:transglycosylase SLT domain-containing protein [Urechidicola sp. KH5]